MSESDNQQTGGRVKTRSRNALADISNTVYGAVTSLTRRNGNTNRKRKLSVKLLKVTSKSVHEILSFFY